MERKALGVFRVLMRNEGDFSISSYNQRLPADGTRRRRDFQAANS